MQEAFFWLSYQQFDGKIYTIVIWILAKKQGEKSSLMFDSLISVSIIIKKERM